MSDKQAKNSAHPNLNVGRKAGSANKSTAQAREAIAAFVDGNAHKMQEWLEKVADGVYDEVNDKWIAPPNPSKAFELLQNVMEYHVPKLARTEHVGENNGPIKYEIEWSK